MRPSFVRSFPAPPVLFLLLLLIPRMAPGAVNPFESDAVPQPANRIDELVFAQLERLKIPPANPCSDAAFVRRTYLDVIGTLPTAQENHRWIRDSIRDNKPYDRFARELLLSSGSNFRVGPVNFYRAMQNRQPAGIAQAVALTFMGARADQWPTNRLAGMSAFFARVGYKYTSEWKEEI